MPNACLFFGKNPRVIGQDGSHHLGAGIMRARRHPFVLAGFPAAGRSACQIGIKFAHSVVGKQRSIEFK